jgi:hypothetical protein
MSFEHDANDITNVVVQLHGLFHQEVFIISISVIFPSLYLDDDDNDDNDDDDGDDDGDDDDDDGGDDDNDDGGGDDDNDDDDT